MTRLISQYEADFGPCEEDEAMRLRAEHGWQRACTLSEVFERTLPRPYRAFWFRVSALLAGQNDGVLACTIRKEREAPVAAITGRLYVTIAGVKVTRAEYERFVLAQVVGTS